MKRRKLVTSMVALGVVAGLLGGGIQSQSGPGHQASLMRFRKPILPAIRMQTGSLKRSWLRQRII